MKISKHNKEVFWVLAIMLLAVSFSLSQTIIYLLNTPSGFSFQFAHNFIEDYYYYLHIMRQGWEGNYLATSRLTPEIYPAMFVVPFFLFLGHIARILNLSLPFTYTMARVIGGIGLIGLIYGLVRVVYPESLIKRLLALIFVCFGTSWWIFNNGQIYPSSLVHDWTELDPIFRLTFIPHHLWSKVFMVLSFIFIYQLLTRGRTKKNYLKLTLSIIFMGFTNPVTLSTFLPVIGLWMGLELIRQILSTICAGPARSTFCGYPEPQCVLAPGIRCGALGAPRARVTRTYRFYIPFTIAVILGLLIALYHRLVQNSVFPWTSYLAWEKVQYPISIISYLKSLGPLFLLFLIGLPVLFKKQYIGSLLLAWVAAGFALLFIVGPLLPLTNSRYLGGYQFIPIGIGSVEGLWILGWLFLKIMQKAKCKINIRIIMITLIIGLIGYFIVGIYASWRQQINYVKINQNNPQVYLPNQLLVAFQFLDKQTSSGTVILAPYYVSTMIPAFTGSRVVAGHQMMTQDYSQKKEAIEEFYSYPKRETAEQILKQHNVSFVIFPKEKLPPLTYLQSLSLSKVYENPAWEIERVGK